MDILRDNYLKWKIGKDFIQVSVDKPNWPIKSFFDETINQLTFVYENKTKPVYIFLSGGLDSEYLIHVMALKNFDFTAVICRWCNIDNSIIYNDLDVEGALKICQKLNIEPLIYDFQYDRYIESGEGIKDSYLYMQNTFAHFYTLIYARIIKDLNCCALFGGEFYGIKVDPITNRWIWHVTSHQMGWWKVFEQNGLEGSPFFLCYSSEMLFAFLNNPEIKKLKSGQYPGCFDHESTKGLVYNCDNNFNLEPYNTSSGRIKMTGLEKLKTSKIWYHPNQLQMWKIAGFTGPNMYPDAYKEDLELFLRNHGALYY